MRALTLLLLVCLSACKGEPAAAPAPAVAAAPAADAPALALMDRVGDRVALVLTFDFEAWQTLHAAAGRLLAGAPREVQRGLSMGADPLRLAQQVLGLAAAPELPGLDRSRPLVVGVGEVADDGLGRAALAVLDGAPIAGLLHRVALPASDPKALASALESLLTQAGARSIQVETGSGWFWPGRDPLRLVVVPRSDHVQLVVESAASAAFDTAPVWGPPLAVTAPARTAGYLAMASEPHAVAALVRPARLRAAGAAAGAVQVVRALALVSDEHRGRLFAKGMQIVMGCEAMMAPAGLEFADHLVGLRADAGALRIRTVSTPTALGAQALNAGGSTRARLRVAGQPLVEAWLGLDAGAMLAAVPVPAAFADEARVVRALRSIQECGSWGNAHFAFGAPLGLLRALDQAARAEDPRLPPAPRNVQAALLKLDPPQGAVTFELPAGSDPAAYRRLAERAGPGVRFAASGRRVSLGFGVEPAKLFSGAAPGDALGGVRATLSGFAADDAAGDAILAAFSRLEGRAWRVGPSWVTEWVMGAPSGAAAPRSLNLTGAAPVPAARPPSAGQACLARALLGGSRALDAVGQVAPDQMGPVVARALAELEPDLACAQRDPATRALALGARRVLLEPVRESLTRGWRHAELATLLEAQCAASRADGVCAGVAPAKALARFSLPTARRACGDDRGGAPGHADVRVVLFDTDLTVDGELMGLGAPADQAALTRAIRAKLDAARSRADAGLRFDDAPEDDAKRAFGTVEIAVGPDASARVLEQLLDVLRGLDPRRVVFPVRADSGVVRWAHLDLFDLDRPARDELVATGFQPDDQLLIVADAATAMGAPGARARAPLVDRGPVHPVRVEHPESRVFVVPDASLRAGQRWVVEAASVCGWVVLARRDDLPAPRDGDVPALGKSVIQSVLKAHSARLRGCYEQLLTRAPDAAGTLTARISVASSGVVKRVEFSQDTLGDPPMAACVSAVIRAMRFPVSQGPTVVNYPFHFRSSD